MVAEIAHTAWQNDNGVPRGEPGGQKRSTPRLGSTLIFAVFETGKRTRHRSFYPLGLTSRFIAEANRRDGITGFLLSDGYAFVQVLEGPESKVQARFSRICEDSRNCNPQVLEARPATGALFPRWSMCGLNLTGRDNVVLRPGHIGFNLLGATPGALLQHLQTLAQRYGPELEKAHAPLLKRSS
ncbi:MAG: BLUF domain-containing protein [Proteobacteria bacterium]|nr:BLUF domain-containing protein [Pseudomonadota bacterium]